MIAVILATGVAFLSEYKSDREFEVLNAAKDSVTRQGAARRRRFTRSRSKRSSSAISSCWKWATRSRPTAGSCKATELLLDQSLMTGETEPVRKSKARDDDTADGPDQPGCLYRGTQVVDGVGQMLVTEVGDDTMIGQIARRLSADDDEDEPTFREATPSSRARSASSTS